MDKITRIAAFIDGYNLYHGIVDAGMAFYLWVDLHELVRRLTPKTNTEIVAVNYFTARAKTSTSAAHQDAFISANEALHREFHAVYGFMMASERHCICTTCAQKPQLYVEKRTDVNLAVAMVKGALKPEPDYDLALLITGDADQCATIEAVQEAGLKVLVAFPPERRSEHLIECCDNTHLEIKASTLRGSQMKDSIVGKSGLALDRPNWGPRPGEPDWPGWPPREPKGDSEGEKAP